jgi:hypothetical protein
MTCQSVQPDPERTDQLIVAVSFRYQMQFHYQTMLAIISFYVQYLIPGATTPCLTPQAS